MEEEYKFSTSSKRNMKGIDKRLISLLKKVLKKSEYDFGVPEYGGLRTPQQQNNLYHRKPKVTNLDGFHYKSYHQTGKAMDLFMLDENGACWDTCIEKYNYIAELMKSTFAEMKESGTFEENEFLEWGGDWKQTWKQNKDRPHFQLVEK